MYEEYNWVKKGVRVLPNPSGDWAEYGGKWLKVKIGIVEGLYPFEKKFGWDPYLVRVLWDENPLTCARFKFTDILPLPLLSKSLKDYA